MSDAVVTPEGRASVAPAGNALLSIRDLCVSFQDDSGWTQVLNNVSLAVNPGETVGIVGESGCGKSLTALSILGLLPKRGVLRTGEINFEGRDLVKLSESEMRRVVPTREKSLPNSLPAALRCFCSRSTAIRGSSGGISSE